MKTTTLTQLSMLIALTVLLGVVPNLGMIQVGPVALTILHIPVIIAAALFGIKGGAIVGLSFGVTSWFVAATRAATPIDLLFVNPLVSVLPRVLFGIVAGMFCQATLFKKDNSVKYAAVGFVSTLIHSFLVYFCLYFCGKEIFFPDTNITGAISNFVPFIVSAFTINSLIEAVVAALILALLMKAIKTIRKN